MPYMGDAVYTPSAAELARAQAWAAANGGGTAQSPWTIQGNAMLVPLVGNATYPLVTFGWGVGWFTGYPAPGGAGVSPVTDTLVPSLTAPTTTSVASLFSSPLVLVGAALAAWFLFFRKKR